MVGRCQISYRGGSILYGDASLCADWRRKHFCHLHACYEFVDAYLTFRACALIYPVEMSWQGRVCFIKQPLDALISYPQILIAYVGHHLQPLKGMIDERSWHLSPAVFECSSCSSCSSCRASKIGLLGSRLYRPRIAKNLAAITLLPD